MYDFEYHREHEERTAQQIQDQHDQDIMAERVLQLEHLLKQKEIEKKNLMSDVYDLQERENSLLRKEQIYMEDNSRLKSQNELLKDKGKNLRSEIDFLQVCLGKTNRDIKRLTEELGNQVSETEKKQTKIDSLEATAFYQRIQITDAEEVIRDRDEIAKELNHTKSLLDSLRLSLLEHEEKDKDQSKDLPNYTDSSQDRSKDLDDENLSVLSDSVFDTCMPHLPDDGAESIADDDTFYACMSHLSDEDMESIAGGDTFYNCKTHLSDEDTESTAIGESTSESPAPVSLTRRILGCHAGALWVASWWTFMIFICLFFSTPVITVLNELTCTNKLNCYLYELVSETIFLSENGGPEIF